MSPALLLLLIGVLLLAALALGFVIGAKRLEQQIAESETQRGDGIAVDQPASESSPWRIVRGGR